MADSTRSSLRANGQLAAWSAGLAAVGVTLYSFPPAQYHFYPVCPIHALTGYLCPGCGATRALAALLHGDFAAAFQFNAFFCAVLLPGMLIYGAIALGRGRWIALPPSVVYAFALVASAFTLARNLH